MVFYFLVFPNSSVPNHFDNIDEPKKGFNRRCQSLVAIRVVSRNSHSDGELEVIASHGEALGGAERVAQSAAARGPQGQEEDEDEAEDEGDGDADDRHYLVDDLAALVREQDEDGVQKANQGPGRYEPQEQAVVAPQAEARQHGRAQRDPEEGADAGRDDLVRDI